MPYSRAMGIDSLKRKLDGYVAFWGSAYGNFLVHLMGAATTQIPLSVPGDFTEIVYTGYAPVPVSTEDFGDAFQEDEHAEKWCNIVTAFATVPGGVNLYGYWVTDVDETVYAFGETFATPLALVADDIPRIRLILRDDSIP